MRQDLITFFAAESGFLKRYGSIHTYAFSGKMTPALQNARKKNIKAGAFFGAIFGGIGGAIKGWCVGGPAAPLVATGLAANGMGGGAVAGGTVGEGLWEHEVANQSEFKDWRSLNYASQIDEIVNSRLKEDPFIIKFYLCPMSGKVLHNPVEVSYKNCQQFCDAETWKDSHPRQVPPTVERVRLVILAHKRRIITLCQHEILHPSIALREGMNKFLENLDIEIKHQQSKATQQLSTVLTSVPKLWRFKTYFEKELADCVDNPTRVNLRPYILYKQ